MFVDMRFEILDWECRSHFNSYQQALCIMYSRDSQLLILPNL